MGVVLSTLWNLFMGLPEFKVCMIGLDNAGKTSILYRLHLGEAISTYPTIGSNVEELTIQNVHLKVWDLGGQQDLRATWSLYYLDAKALIMVIDSTDYQRMDLAREELHLALQSEELSNSIVLIFANKQDIRSSLTVSEISDVLELSSIKVQPWRIQPCSALTGEGLVEGMAWIAQTLRTKKM